MNNQDGDNLLDKARDVGAEAREKFSDVDDKFKSAVPRKRRPWVFLAVLVVLVFGLAFVVDKALAASVYAVSDYDVVSVANDLDSCEQFRQKVIDRGLVHPSNYGAMPYMYCRELEGPPAPQSVEGV